MAGFARVGIKGVKQIKATLQQMTGDGAVSTADIYRILKTGAQPMADAVRAGANAISPHIGASVEFFADPPPNPTKKKTALITLNKQVTMRRWIAAKSNKSPNAKVAPGGQVAESLAMMREIGTSRMAATPFFRPAVTATRATVRQNLQTGFQQFIEDVAAKRDPPTE